MSARLHAVASRALLCLALLASSAALASDPTPPARLITSPQGFVVGLQLEGIATTQLSASLSFTRLAGQVVPDGVTTFLGVPVKRALALQGDGASGWFYDARPTGPGVPALADGVYGVRLELVVSPRPHQVAFTQRATLYFRAQAGVFTRLSLGAYSNAVEPTIADTDKTGISRRGHVGLVGQGVAKHPVSHTDVRIESGAAFVTPGQALEQ